MSALDDLVAYRDENRELAQQNCEMESRVNELEAENERLTNEYLALRRDYEALRRGTDRVKVRAYELGQMELHDLAWSALIGEGP